MAFITWELFDWKQTEEVKRLYIAAANQLLQYATVRMEIPREIVQLLGL